MMLIDNMIQSPIAGTSVTTTLADSAALAQDVINLQVYHHLLEQIIFKLVVVIR